MKGWMVAFVVMAGMSACAESVEPGDSVSQGPLAEVDSALTGPHCKTSCPKCPPHQICPMYMCIQQCTYPAGYCEADTDCETQADYCHGGCDCDAASVYDSETSTACPHPVNCFADACLNRTATCDVASHTCVLN